MTKPWISREAAEALREAIGSAMTHYSHHDPTGRAGSGCPACHDRARFYEVLDTLHIVDAGDGEAEAALRRLVLVARGLGSYGLIGPPDATAYTDEATVRHALRAAKAREALPPDADHALMHLKPVVIDSETLAAPTPDVIRRGHEAVEYLRGMALQPIVAQSDAGKRLVERYVSAIRAAMHPLPKEE